MAFYCSLSRSLGLKKSKWLLPPAFCSNAIWNTVLPLLFYKSPHLASEKSILGLINATNHQLISQLVSVGLNKRASTGLVPFPPPAGLVAILLMWFIMSSLLLKRLNNRTSAISGPGACVSEVDEMNPWLFTSLKAIYRATAVHPIPEWSRQHLQNIQRNTCAAAEQAPDYHTALWDRSSK